MCTGSFHAFIYIYDYYFIQYVHLKAAIVSNSVSSSSIFNTMSIMSFGDTPDLECVHNIMHM